MVLSALRKLVRPFVSTKLDCGLSGQRLGTDSALSSLHDTEFTGSLFRSGASSISNPYQLVGVVSMDEWTSAGAEAPPVKRKRGRPRKADILAAQAATAMGIGAPPVKRKRGRPRKADIVAAQAAAASGIGAPPVKGKRGRPRKAYITAAHAGTAANDRIVSVPNDVVGLVSESGYESFFTGTSDSDWSSDINYDEYDHTSDEGYDGYGQATPNLIQNSEYNASSKRDFDDDDQETRRLTQSSESNSSSDSDYDEGDHNSDEDFNYLEEHIKRGTKKTKKTKRRRGCNNVNYKEPASGPICHWCRQRTERLHVRCSLCIINFCPACLMNRNGEKIQEEMRSCVRWVCPRCRGGCGLGCKNCCNCGPCRRTQGKPPTGALAYTAREAGFSNVHDYLINLATGESAEVIASRKEGRGWTYATGAVVEVSPIPPWGMKGLRTPKIPLGFLISKCREGREDAMACEMAEAAQLPLPWFESEEQDSCTIQERTGYPCQRVTEFCIQDVPTSPDAMDCQLSSTNSDVSESPSRISREAGGTECWRMQSAVPKRKRSVTKRTARKEDREFNEVEHEKRPEVDISLRGEGAGEGQAELPDLNSLFKESLFELPDLNSPIPTSDGVTNSYSSGQEITGVTMCCESERHVPLSAESGESSLSVRTQLTAENEAEAATSKQATSADVPEVARMVRGDDFRVKLDLILQRPFSSEQLKEMWDHFMFHRPSQQEKYMYYGSNNGEGDELLCDCFTDLYEKLARTFSAVEKLNLLRAFFFWLQNSWMEGAFPPWVTEDGEDDQFGGCTLISISGSQDIDRLLAFDGDVC